MDPEPMSLVSQFILILVLTLLNAFFASAEMAIVSVNRNRIKMLADDGNKKASLLVDLLEEPNKFLSTIQVGITLAGFFSSASAATGISEVIGASLSQLGIPYAQSISLVVITIILSYFTLVFGELVPKRIALQKSEQMAMLSVRPIVFVSKFAKPFVKLLSLSTNLLLRVIGMSDTDLEEKVSREEIKSLVDAGEEYGVINQIEKEMINSQLPLSIEELLEENYSRIPVYEGDMDNIIGILYLKDFLHEAYQVGFENVDIKKLLHRPYFVPECKNIDQLFKELQKSKNHLAVLIDEYGGFSGIVTIEDLIEEVMGDINDEYDDDDPVIRKIDNDTYIVNGLISIKELNDKLQLNLDEETEDYDTLGGFLINQIDYIPSETEECMVEYENLVFKIECVKDKRIEMVKIHIQ